MLLLRNALPPPPVTVCVLGTVGLGFCTAPDGTQSTLLPSQLVNYTAFSPSDEKAYADWCSNKLSLIPHHSSDPICALCSLKLKDAHSSPSRLVPRRLSVAFPDSHVSWSYRDQASQEAAYNDGV